MGNGACSDDTRGSPPGESKLLTGVPSTPATTAPLTIGALLDRPLAEFPNQILKDTELSREDLQGLL